MSEPNSTGQVGLPDYERRWKKLAGRDLQLWSIGFLIMLLMSVGVLSQFAPQWLQGQAIFKLDLQYVPALTLGLIALVMLLNFYLIGQRRSIDLVRYDLIREMALNHALQQVATVDPDTQLFTRAALSKILTSEISRANRFGTDLTFVMLDSENFEAIRRKKSPFTADQMILETSTLLRKTFRGSDTIIRYSKTEFLIVMPQTSPDQGTAALNRLSEAVDHWNVVNNLDFELVLNFGMSSYKLGEPPDIATQRAAQSMRNLQTLAFEVPDLRGIRAAGTLVAPTEVTGN